MISKKQPDILYISREVNDNKQTDMHRNILPLTLTSLIVVFSDSKLCTSFSVSINIRHNFILALLDPVIPLITHWNRRDTFFFLPNGLCFFPVTFDESPLTTVKGIMTSRENVATTMDCRDLCLLFAGFKPCTFFVLKGDVCYIGNEKNEWETEELKDLPQGSVFFRRGNWYLILLSSVEF